MVVFLSTTYDIYESEICFEVKIHNDQLTVYNLKIFYVYHIACLLYLFV